MVTKKVHEHVEIVQEKQNDVVERTDADCIKIAELPSAENNDACLRQVSGCVKSAV